MVFLQNFSEGEGMLVGREGESSRGECFVVMFVLEKQSE
jgi:hypothetical protein